MFAEKPITFRDELEQFLQTLPTAQQIVNYRIPEHHQERMQLFNGCKQSRHSYGR